MRNIAVVGGCFDILTPAHLRLIAWVRPYLAGRLRARPTELWLLLNGDRRIRELKGPGRPVFPLEQRVFMAEQLSLVDHVSWFDEDTPCKWLAENQPRWWIKGGDYCAELLPEYPIVTGYGGQVVIAPTFDGPHASDLAQRIAGNAQAPVLR